jgi:hypothetical protein
VTRYGGSFGVVVTTDRVAEEAKRFFQEQRPAMDTRIESLEGQSGIQDGNPTLVDRVSRSGVNQLLLELTESLGLNLVPILQARIDQHAAARAASALQPPSRAVVPRQDVEA